MDNKEKVVWLQCLSAIWGVLLAVVCVTGFFPGPRAMDGFRTMSAMAIVFTAAYLLILSWRVAYLSGRKKR